jgi:predicted ATP-grasp superfamily ATP-dependent carboligase
VPRGGAAACVIGDIDLVRALGLAGIPSVVVAPPGDFARYSRHRRAAIGRLDAASDPERLATRLLEFARTCEQPPVLYYNGDWDLLMVSRLRDSLGEAFRFVIPERELVEELVDKRRFQRRAAQLGLPVPRAIELGAGEALPASGELRFPVVVKPLTRRHATWKPLTGAKVLRVSSPEDLRATWEQGAFTAIDVLIQEEIPGPESLVESYHAYIGAGGEVVGDFTGRKIRTYPPAHGYSTALEVTHAPDVAALGRDVLERLSFTGVAKLDFKRNPRDGSLNLLEVNPRFSLWHHPGAKAGVNIPALVYRDMYGLPRGPRPTARAGVRWCSPWRDFKAIRADGPSLLKWIPWALASEAKCAVAWDDPLPLPVAALYRAIRGDGRARRDATTVPD